jgi:hypothetical protein
MTRITGLAALGALCAFSLVGCQSGPDQHQQFANNVLSRPIPQTDDGKRQECADIRAEMARVRGIAAVGAQQPGMWAAIHIANAERVLAVWSQRASDVGCTAAFSNAPTPAAAQKDPMTACMDACETRAKKSGPECFEICRAPR